MIDYEKRAKISKLYAEKYNRDINAYKANLKTHSNERLVEKYEGLLSKVWKKKKLLKNDFLTYLYGVLGGFHESTSVMDWHLEDIKKGYGDIKSDRVFIIGSIYYLYMLDIEISKWIEEEQKEKEDGRIIKTNIGWLNSFMDWIQTKKNTMVEEVKVINENVFSLMNEVQADIADTRIERGALMVQLEDMMNSLAAYEKAYLTRLEKENGKSKVKKLNEQKEEEITNSQT